ncbi:hypothetical protein FQA39_LY09091 [Lamprigera yunnana]|nr:hypothetical protein FQA39_LY09091 [Lamprigera yunnana]
MVAVKRRDVKVPLTTLTGVSLILYDAASFSAVEMPTSENNFSISERERLRGRKQTKLESIVQDQQFYNLFDDENNGSVIDSDHESIDSHDSNSVTEVTDNDDISDRHDEENSDDVFLEKIFEGKDKITKRIKLPPPASRRKKPNIVTHLSGTIGTADLFADIQEPLQLTPVTGPEAEMGPELTYTELMPVVNTENDKTEILFSNANHETDTVAFPGIHQETEPVAYSPESHNTDEIGKNDLKRAQRSGVFSKSRFLNRVH